MNLPSCPEDAPAARSGWNARRSPQLLVQKFARPLVGERRRGILMAQYALSWSRMVKKLKLHSLSWSRSTGSRNFASTANQQRCALGSVTISTLRIKSPLRCNPKIVRHVTEGLQDFRIFELAEFGTSRRENATAPAFTSSADIAWARRMAAAEWGHSAASPGANPPSTRTKGNAT
jgi:hypothetical protein